LASRGAEADGSASRPGRDTLARRPKLAAALKAARKLKAPVVFAKLDRLSRDVHFVSGLMAEKAPFIVADLGPETEWKCPRWSRSLSSLRGDNPSADACQRVRVVEPPDHGGAIDRSFRASPE
jgi:hypothetical protein